MQVRAGKYNAFRFLLWCEIISFFLRFTFYPIYNIGGVIDMLLAFFALCLTFSVSNISKKSRLTKVAAIIALILLPLSWIANIYSLGFGGIYILIRYILYYLLLPYIPINDKDKKCLFLICLLMFIVNLFVDKSTYNTNSIGLLYLALGVYSTINFDLSKKKQFLLFTGFSFIIIYFISLTNSRTCTFAYFFYFLIRIFSPILFKKKSIYYLMILMLTVGSLVYAKLYIYMSDKNLIEEEYVQLATEEYDKRIFSGRDAIWKECFNLLDENPLTGVGSKFELKSYRIVNVHHSILDILVVYGYPIGILCLYMMITACYRLHAYMSITKVRNGVCAYFAFLLVGFSETVLLLNVFVSLLGLYYAYNEALNYQLKK